jgi:hypothetical protein
MKMTSKQYNRFSNVFWIVGSVLGYVTAYKLTLLGGCLLMGFSAAVGLLSSPVVTRMETRERFTAEYGSYEGFLGRAHEVVDYERLFRYRDAGKRRQAVAFMTRHVWHMPRPYARRFVDGLTEADRPAVPPPFSSSSPTTAPRKEDDA